MKPKKVAVLGGAGAGPIRAVALLESILAERENPTIIAVDFGTGDSYSVIQIMDKVTKEHRVVIPEKLRTQE